MARKGKEYKYHQYVTLGYVDGKRVRRHIHGASKAEFDRNVREAFKEFESVRNPSVVTFGRYIDQWKSVYLSNREANTVLYYETALAKFGKLRNKPLKQVTKTDLQDIINADWDRPRTCVKLRQVASKVMETAIDDGYINYNPARRLALPKYRAAEKRALTDAERQAVRNVDLPAMEHLALTLLYVFGLRPEELRALTRNSFDLDRKELRIFSAAVFRGNTPYLKDTKNHLHRTLPVPDSIMPEIRSYLYGLGSLYLFHMHDGGLMTKSSFTKFTGRILGAINRAMGGTPSIRATDMTLYTFRHNAGTQLYYVQGMSNKKKAAFMGHSEDIFLKTYSHLDESREDVSGYFDAIGM